MSEAGREAQVDEGWPVRSPPQPFPKEMMEARMRVVTVGHGEKMKLRNVRR